MWQLPSPASHKSGDAGYAFKSIKFVLEKLLDLIAHSILHTYARIYTCGLQANVNALRLFTFFCGAREQLHGYDSSCNTQ